jgi:hypothetical protein
VKASPIFSMPCVFYTFYPMLIVPTTCFRLHVVMRRMPRIDPSQLLTTLSVLLAPDGGIRSADDVSILLLITSYSLTYSLTYSLHFPYLLSPCFITVADRGCSSRIQSFPSRIQGQKISRIRIKQFKYFNQNIVSKLSEL